MNVIETERLILRTWEEDDVYPYFLINQDSKVIEFLPSAMSMSEVRDFINKVNNKYKKYGYTLFATALKDTGKLIGFIGLNYTDFPASFTLAVEIGWRLGSQYWGKGYATEGAKAVLDFGFNQCNLKEIVSFTAINNIKSIKVMQRLGMLEDIERKFNHPNLLLDHSLSLHVLYHFKKYLYKN